MNRSEVASTLGLAPEQVTDDLLRRIADDRSTLDDIEACRDDPEMLALLLGPAPAASTPSSTELVARAAGAFSRWAAAGFGRVDAEAYEQRRAACNGCEHLTTPSTRLVRLMAGGAANTKVACGLCGCDVRKKAWLLTESCPDGRWPQAEG